MDDEKRMLMDAIIRIYTGAVDTNSLKRHNKKYLRELLAILQADESRVDEDLLFRALKRLEDSMKYVCFKHPDRDTCDGCANEHVENCGQKNMIIACEHDKLLRGFREQLFLEKYGSAYWDDPEEYHYNFDYYPYLKWLHIRGGLCECLILKEVI